MNLNETQSFAPVKAKWILNLCHSLNRKDWNVYFAQREIDISVERQREIRRRRQQQQRINLSDNHLIVNFNTVIESKLISAIQISGLIKVRNSSKEHRIASHPYGLFLLDFPIVITVVVGGIISKPFWVQCVRVSLSCIYTITFN